MPVATEVGAETRVRDGRIGVAVVDARHAEAPRGQDVGLDVVDEHARLGGQPDPAERVLEDARLGLAHADLAGDHDRVEELVPAVPGIDVGPGVGQQAGLDAVALDVVQHVVHRVDPLEAGEHPLQQPFGLGRHSVDGPQPGGQVALERGPVHLPALQRVHDALPVTAVGLVDQLAHDGSVVGVVDAIRLDPLADGDGETGREHPTQSISTPVIKAPPWNLVLG